jgi:hypothetical protein
LASLILPAKSVDKPKSFATASPASNAADIVFRRHYVVGRELPEVLVWNEEQQGASST